MIQRNYCSKCKRTDIKLVKYSTNPKGTIQYYYCVECNNARAKAYYSTDEGFASHKRSNTKTWDKYRYKQTAREAVAMALKTGRLVKPDKCEICAYQGRIEGHHNDYSRPLAVVWVCTTCHSQNHI